ncbi:DMT family transporter [Nonomuraea sp. NPDC050790]|uniref:DMT family transporter n=1 Tax=Nonomuraea sp. NPDC050790 TaxID=3364371 RepID=UPI00379AF1EC
MSRALLITAAVGWGAATTATEYALGGFGPLTLLVVKLAAATAVLWTVLMARGGPGPAPGQWRFALLGLFEPALAYGGLTLGLSFTTATNASLLGATESAFVLVLAAMFLKERIRGRAVLGLVLALLGVLVLDGGGLGGFNPGDLIVLGGSLAAAVYVTLAAKTAPGVDALTMTTYQFTYATVIVAPLALWPWVSGHEPPPTGVALPYWLAAIFVGGVCFALGFVLYNHAIRHIPAGTAGVILNMVPVIGVLTAVALLGETPTAWHVAGAALVVAGIMLFPVKKEEARTRRMRAPVLTRAD